MAARRLSSLLLVAALMTSSVPARAEDGDAEAFDWNKFWDYAGCAAAIVTLGTGPAAVLGVVVGCGRVVTKYWT